LSQSQTGAMNLVEEAPFRWRIDPVGQMCVPGIMFASRSLLPDVISDRSLHQVDDVATLPGIVEASNAMPDVHWGYGFPIGGASHNLAKLEPRIVDQERRVLCVHRRGATRALRAHSDRGLAEEAPFSCKDVDEVVATRERAGLARRVARLRPVGVVKG
jgi:RNA-splicing ligase RtcB